MTDEELRNRAREFVCQLASGFPQEIEYYANILVEFANEIIKELEKARDETQELLDKQIEATYKVVEENNKLREYLSKLIELKNKPKYVFASFNTYALYANICAEVEQFLKEVKNERYS